MGLPRTRLLLVDDDDDLRVSLAEALEESGYVVHPGGQWSDRARAAGEANAPIWCCSTC